MDFKLSSTKIIAFFGMPFEMLTEKLIAIINAVSDANVANILSAFCWMDRTDVTNVASATSF
jgi:hypothetical protein